MTIQVHHVDASRADELPYFPAITVEAGTSRIIFVAGQSPLPLYHSHPHIKEETILPDDIEEQTRRAIEKIRTILESCGANLGNVMKITKYLTDMREAPLVHKTLREYFGEWKPVSTTVGIHSLSAPGSRVELDVIAVQEIG